MRKKIINILNYFLKILIILKNKLSIAKTIIINEDELLKKMNYSVKDIYNKECFNRIKQTKKGIDVSIIIPVYNSEKYLSQCLTSILNQKTKYSYEVICINDGSKDNSLSILKEFKKKYSHLTIINQENKGISGARNTGINNANGKYIGFIDNDDYVTENYIEVLLSLAYEKNADIVKCNHVNFLSNCENKVLNIVRNENTSITGNMKEKVLSFKGYIWGGIFKLELFNNVRFPIGYWYEDMIMRIILMRKCNQFEYIDRNLYYYNIHDTNASKIVWKSNDSKCMDQYYLAKQLVEYSKEIGLKDSGEIYLILLQELGNILWLRTRKLSSKFQKQIFYLACNYINQYSSNGIYANTFENKILSKAFKNRDYFLWKLISLYMIVGIRYGKN